MEVFVQDSLTLLSVGSDFGKLFDCAMSLIRVFDLYDKLLYKVIIRRIPEKKICKTYKVIMQSCYILYSSNLS